MNGSQNSCGPQSILTILLVASIALNIAFLSGCSLVEPFRGGAAGGPSNRDVEKPTPKIYDATSDLQEIASRLGVESPGNNAYDIASAIKTKLYVDAESKGFPKDVLSAKQFEETKDVLPADKAKIISDYQEFIKSLEGKRFVIIP